MNLKPHPLADLFPRLRGRQLRELADDIKLRGLLEPITIYENRVLDGRNRLAACRLAKVRPTFQVYRGRDALGHVVSLNLRRRHLSESQRAMVAARISRLRKGTNQYKKMGPKNFGTITQSEAARRFKISDRSIQHAAVVRDYGSRALNRAVDDDRVSVFTAASIARLPKKRQRKAIDKLLNGADPGIIISIARKHRQKRAEKRHQERIAKLIKLNGKNPKLSTTQRYSVILADCPFSFDWSPARRYSPASHYPVMSVEQLCKLPVRKIASPDCVVFMWAPSGKLEEALEIMRAWGFSYKSAMVWVKEGSPGLGIYTRQQHELLLIGARGSLPVPLPSQRPSSVFFAPRRGHSTKPDIVYDMIQKMYPQLPKLELFARRTRPNWSSWGNEISEREAA